MKWIMENKEFNNINPNAPASVPCSPNILVNSLGVEEQSPILKSCDEVLRVIDEKLKAIDESTTLENSDKTDPGEGTSGMSGASGSMTESAAPSQYLKSTEQSFRDMFGSLSEAELELIRAKKCVPPARYKFCAELAGVTIPQREDHLKVLTENVKLKFETINKQLTEAAANPQPEENMDIDEVSNERTSITGRIIECLNNNEPGMKSKNTNGLQIDSHISEHSFDLFKLAYARFSQKSIQCESGVFSVRDLALASTSSQDIEFIDADGDYLESMECNAKNYKTDMKDSKLFRAFSDNRILGLQDLWHSLTDSTNFSLCYKEFNDMIPLKSNLKRKLTSTPINSKTTKIKKSLRFTNITIFYFERTQGFSSIPTKGGSTLGMVNHHFYITTLPVEEYEHKKVQKVLPRTRSNNIISYRRNEKPKNVEALSCSQRVQLLESSQVRIEITEDDECAMIRSSRVAAGCDCKEYCDPDVCFCSMSGIECQVDRPNFPCSCTREHCRNIMGRNEYNHAKVKTHFVKTIRKMKTENKGRCSKRKQSTPSRAVLNSSEIVKDDTGYKLKT